MIHLKRVSPAALLVVVLWLAGLACTAPGFGALSAESTPPTAAIVSPTAGEPLVVGQEVQVLSTSVGADGVIRVELVVDGEVVWVDANADPQPDAPFIVSQPWTPDAPGSHIIQVRAYDKNNVPGQSDPVVVEVVTVSAQTAGNELPASEPTTATPSPTVAALAPVPTSTRAPTATPTSAPVTDTPSPPATATPTPGLFAPTGIEPEGRFRKIWLELGDGNSRLGYPVAPAITDRDYARQYFERGLMFWWDNPDDPDYIWVLNAPAADFNSGAGWDRYPDEWGGGDIYSCDSARTNAEKGPVRGFGYLWCSRFDVQARLGNPREPEAGSGGNPPFSQVQFFQGGVMLYNPFNAEVYVLFDQGDWLRFQRE